MNTAPGPEGNKTQSTRRGPLTFRDIPGPSLADLEAQLGKANRAGRRGRKAAGVLRNLINQHGRLLAEAAQWSVEAAIAVHDAVAPVRDLTKDGDVEKNPGPRGQMFKPAAMPSAITIAAGVQNDVVLASGVTLSSEILRGVQTLSFESTGVLSGMTAMTSASVAAIYLAPTGSPPLDLTTNVVDVPDDYYLVVLSRASSATAFAAVTSAGDLSTSFTYLPTGSFDVVASLYNSGSATITYTPVPAASFTPGFSYWSAGVPQLISAAVSNFPASQDVVVTDVDTGGSQTDPLEVGGGSITSGEVVIVGINPITTPLWVSEVRSAAPPIVPPAPSLLLSGDVEANPGPVIPASEAGLHPPEQIVLPPAPVLSPLDFVNLLSDSERAEAVTDDQTAALAELYCVGGDDIPLTRDDQAKRQIKQDAAFNWLRDHDRMPVWLARLRPTPPVATPSRPKPVRPAKTDDPWAELTEGDVPQALDHVVGRRNGARAVIAYLLPPDVEWHDENNPFDVLRFEPDEVDGPDVDAPAAPERRVSFGGAARTHPTPAKKPASAPRAAASPAAPVKTPAEQLAQRSAVLERIANRLRTGGDDAVVAWFLRAPKASWALEVIRLVWGSEWSASDSWQRWFVSCRLSKTGRDVEWRGYAELAGRGDQFTPLFRSLTETEAWQAWSLTTLRFSWINDAKVFAAEAAAHNQAMHALVGNTIFAGDMDEVRALPSGTALYDTPPLDNGPKPEVLALELSTLQSSTNPHDVDVATSMPFRADRVNADNTVTAGVTLPFSGSLGVPRVIRNGAAAPATTASTNRLSTFIVGTMSYLASRLEDSELMKSIVEAAIRANQNLGRADNVTLGGFQAFDVAYVGRTKSYYGLSMQSCLAKLVALSLINNFGQSRNYLPLSGEAGAYDPYTQLDPSGSIAIGYNDSAVFGEDCGGDAAELPFRGGEQGQIYFHATLETVPEESRSLAIFCPANLVQADEQSGFAIFLLATMFADWPTLMWNYTLPTLDTAGAQAADQQFIPHLATMFIPGLVDLHIVLPRRTTSANPASQERANSLVLVQPSTGSVPSSTLAADTFLDVNYVGGTLTGYPLAEYCYTWGQDSDSTSITQFMQRLNDLVDINAELKHVYERVATMGVRYQPLVSQTFAGTTKLAANSAPGWAQTSSMGVQATPTTGDWPQATIPRPDFMLFETDIVAWNKVVLTVALASGRMGTGSALTYYQGNPQSLYWLKLFSRQQAAVTNVHLGLLGWSTATWDTAYGNTDMRSFRTLARAHYAGAAAGSLAPQPALLGPKLAALFTALIGASPTRDLAGNTVFDYTAPPRGASRGSIITTAGVALTNCAPVFLADFEIHTTCRTVPRCFSSFPPQNNEGSTTGLLTPDMRALILGGGTIYGPMLRGATPKNALRQIDTRDDTDEEIWNARLLTVIGTAPVMYDMAGNVVAGSPTAGTAPKPGIITADYTLTNYVTGVSSIATTWVPRVQSNGLLQFPADSRANMIAVSKVEAGINRAAIQIWAVNGILPSGDMKLGSDESPNSMWLSMLRAAPASSSQGGVQPEPAIPALGSGEAA